MRFQDRREAARRSRRLRAAAIAVVVGASVAGYALVSPRHVQVQADGRDINVETRSTSDGAVLRQAGVEVQPGDRVTAIRRGDGDGDVIRVERARDIAIIADGAEYHVRTRAGSVGELLDEMSIVLNQRDSILLDGLFVSTAEPLDTSPRLATIAEDGSTSTPRPLVEVRRAVAFTIVEDGRETLSTSSRATIAQALREAGVVVGPGDRVSPDPVAALAPDTRIDVRHARPVTVALPSGHTVIYSLAATVADALDEAGIVVPDGAFVTPDPRSPVFYGMSVRVVQLSASSDEEREFVASKTTYVGDASLPAGDTRVVEGHDGAIVRRYAITYVDGAESGRDLISESYDPEPVDTVVYYSTRPPEPPPTPVAAPAEAVPGRVLRVYATYYTAASSGRPPSDPSYGITATGVRVARGVVAVDPEVIPLGTKLYIPGYGYAVAADTGGAVKGYIIDLGFPDGEEVDWQPQWVDVTIVE